MTPESSSSPSGWLSRRCRQSRGVPRGPGKGSRHAPRWLDRPNSKGLSALERRPDREAQQSPEPSRLPEKWQWPRGPLEAGGETKARHGLRTVSPGARCSTNTNRHETHVRRTVSSSASPKGKHAQSEKYSTLPKSAFIEVNKSSEYSLPKPNERWPLPAASPIAGQLCCSPSRLCQKEPSPCRKRYFSRDRLCRYQCF